MKEEISNCCKAYVSIDTGDEGTSCYVCHSCNRPCDLFSEMKEQVSVDKEEYEMLKKVFSAWKELQNRQSKSESFGIVKSEWDRLKRLEENVKREIERLKSLTHWPSMSESIIKLLEGLDK